VAEANGAGPPVASCAASARNGALASSQVISASCGQVSAAAQLAAAGPAPASSNRRGAKSGAARRTSVNTEAQAA
jgi:hypothetical protein